MPGYKSLPSFMTGEAADQVREAEARHRIGDSESAVQLLEEALVVCVASRSAYPGWLCGRLAALYRTLGRYDDEVHLLERYRDSQTSEEARTRYDARLCKARTIAERKRRRPSGAIESVRVSLGRPRTRRARKIISLSAAVSAAPAISAATQGELAEALHADAAEYPARSRVALERLAREGIALGAPVELLVSALRSATSSRNGISAEELSARYGATLIQLLELYFEETAE